MEILVCVKRVPTVGGTIAVTADGLSVDTRMSGFAISPHEECAVEEAVQITERLGGTVSVLTLGPPEAADQLREALVHYAETTHLRWDSLPHISWHEGEPDPLRINLGNPCP